MDDISAPPRPQWLDDVAATEWDRVVPLMLGRQTLGQLDLAVLTVYCQAWSAFVMAANKGDTRGVEDSAARLLKAADRLGLSPAAKSRVQTYGTGDKQKPEGLSRFRLAGGESQVA